MSSSPSTDQERYAIRCCARAVTLAASRIRAGEEPGNEIGRAENVIATLRADRPSHSRVVRQMRNALALIAQAVEEPELQRACRIARRAERAATAMLAEHGASVASAP